MFSTIKDETYNEDFKFLFQQILPAEINHSEVDNLCRDLSSLEILAVLEEVDEELNNVLLENMVLENFLQKNDPIFLVDITDEKIRKDIEDRGYNPQKGDQISTSVKSFFKTKSMATSQRAARTQTYKLNVKTKRELSEKEAFEIVRNIKNIEVLGNSKVKEINATIEDINYEFQETDDVLESFNKNVVVLGLDPGTGYINAERFVKFCKNYFIQGMSICAKMRITTQNIDQEISSQKRRLIYTQELKGVISAVDYETALIEKEKLSKSLEERIMTCTHERNNISNNVFAISNHKQLLENSEQRLKSLKNKCEAQQQIINKLVNEETIVNNEIKKSQAQLRKLTNRMEKCSNYPSIQDYFDLNINQNSLLKEKKSLERNIHLLKVKLKNTKNRRRK